MTLDLLGKTCITTCLTLRIFSPDRSEDNSVRLVLAAGNKQLPCQIWIESFPGGFQKTVAVIPRPPFVEPKARRKEDDGLQTAATSLV